MSYDKNTMIFSDITPLTRELIRRKENYYLSKLGTVRALGLNDYFKAVDEIDLRILIYSGGVVLEQMRRTSDCDLDDVIVSEVFNFNELPEKFALEKIVDVHPNKEENFVYLAKFNKFTEQFVK
jgi:hypothetical protein